MKTQVVSITNFQNQFDELEIVVLLGEITQKFSFIVKKSKIKDRILLTFIEDANFAKIFRFNDHLAIAITNLVKNFYQGENINFPINVGDYGTALEALAQQKTFENAYEGEYIYFENDSFGHQQSSSEVINDSQKNHESVKLEGIGEKIRHRLRTTEPAPTHKPWTTQKHTKVYQGENINFPINVGDYGTALEALAQQKTFENACEGEYVYFENDSFEHQQSSSEIISDSQKNHESVKLEGIGEKMRHRLRTTEPTPTHKPRTTQKHPSEIEV